MYVIKYVVTYFVEYVYITLYFIYYHILILIVFTFFFIIIVSIVWITVWYQYYFLRTPDRHTVLDNAIIYSPANGRVIDVFDSKEAVLQCYKADRQACEVLVNDVWDNVSVIVIMLTLWDVHYQRMPTSARVLNQVYAPGTFLNAVFGSGRTQALVQNEHQTLLFQTDQGHRFKVIQIAWLVARRIISLVSDDHYITQWSLIGCIRFGSQVALVLDEHARIEVKKGDYLIDGHSIIGRRV